MSDIPKKPRGKTGQAKAKDLAKSTAIEERQRDVFHFWQENPLIGYRAIGKKFGISHQQAKLDVRAVLTKNAAEFKVEVDAWKEKQIERLEYLLEQFETDVTSSVSDRFEAGRLILRVLREINDITGVRAAVKVEHSGTIGFNWSEITADAASSKNLTDDGD
jgi:hypothetical protein